MVPGSRATGRAGLLFGAGAALFVAFALVMATARARPAVRPEGPPRRVLGATYAGSEACRSCHPGQYESWHRSFHRTMTERPAPGMALPTDARSPVMMTTGSHHYRAFWTEGQRKGELRLAPSVYLMSEQRFVPRAAAFLTPESHPPREGAWNASCIQCHAVAGKPRRTEEADEPVDVQGSHVDIPSLRVSRIEQFASEVAELGIACEACHGPAAHHVDAHRNPFERAWSRVRRQPSAADPTIVNPARLDATNSSRICAQCHSLSIPKDEEAFWDVGAVTELPQRVFDRRDLITLDVLQNPQPGGPRVDAPSEHLFWADGTIRIGGREANGHFLSPCYLRGQGDRQASCLSCHSMHDSEPNDQLRRGFENDRACASCHADVVARGTAHTHHAAGSVGSTCVGCHMPKTTFALLGAIRTHRIESAVGPSSGRMPACNGCHVDRAVAWSARTAGEWYGSAVGARIIGNGESAGSTMIEWLLTGDAAKRALAAAALGSAEARAAAGTDWQAPLLAERLDDSYAAVRYVAGRALGSLPGYENIPFDFVGPPEARSAAQRLARDRFMQSRAGAKVPTEQRARVLLRADGAPDTEALAERASRRDDSEITIAE